jgi:hypothetical protein
MAAVSKWRFKPIIVKGIKKQGCGKLSIKFAMTGNVPTAEVLRHQSATRNRAVKVQLVKNLHITH